MVSKLTRVFVHLDFLASFINLGMPEATATLYILVLCNVDITGSMNQLSATWKLCASEPGHTSGSKDNDVRCQRPSNECRRVPGPTARRRKRNNALSKCVIRPLRSRPTFSEGSLQSVFVTDS